MSDTHVVCSECGATNRLPPARAASEAKCGKCGEKLFSGHPKDVTARNLEHQIARGTVPVVVDVWAPWCGPCRMMAPAYEAASQQLEPDVRLVKLNSDVEQQMAAQMGIRGIPTMILYAGGHEVARTSGAMAAGQIVNWVRQNLGKAAA